MPPPTLTLGLISPHELVRCGLTAVLRPHAARVRPTVVAVDDPDLPSLDLVLYDVAGVEVDGGAELGRLVAAQVRVGVLARPHQPQLTSTALAHGAACVVPITASGEDLLATVVRTARAGRAGGPVAGRQVTARRLGLPHGLTTREYEVLGLVASGLSNGEIAARLFVSVNTVKTYVRAAYRKIGVQRRSQAVIWCVEHGLPG